jgi:hypothetical protein
LAPGARFVAAITATFKVAGDVSSFNRNAFQNALATLMSVLPSAITLDISAGSVVVQTTITYPSSAAAKTAVVTLAAKNTATLSTALGVNVQAVANVAQTVIIVHASPPPPPPPPPSPSPLCVAESATAGNVSMTSAIIFVAIGAIIGAALTMIVWAVLPYGKMRARRVEPVRTAQPAMPVRTAQPAMPARTAQPAMPVRESRQRV